MNRPVNGLLLSLIVAVTLVACGKKEEKAPAASAGSDPLMVKIGAASPLTGPQAHIGIDIRNGTQLGVDDVNAAGLEIGGRKVRLELIAEDDEANPTKATTVAQKLVDAKVVAVVGHFNSGASIPASKIYSDAGIVQISPGSTNPKYTQQGFKTTYRVVANDDQQGPVGAQFAVEKLVAKRVAVIDDSTAYGQGLANAFATKATALGATIVAREHTTDKDTDFTAILTSIKAKDPDLVFFGGIDTQAGPMAKQMAALGIKARFLGGDGMQTPNFIKLAGDSAEGAMASIPGLPKDKMPGGKEFLDKFKAKYKTEVELFAPMGYDAVFVIVEAMKRAGSTEPSKILAEMPKTNYKGVIGPIAFDDKGDLKDGPLTIYEVKSGKWEPLEIIGGPAIASAAATMDAPKDAANDAAKSAGEAAKEVVKDAADAARAAIDRK
ncbi:MAG: branched-chain amino acid ABC transporter substrate-binding protein [Sterolibacteriaceae bacterium]|nr:branched-chain amino acid ABC transporter substrate-binding protein [Sterolibacteriaceae bacterium]MBK9086744.1 branched-chain amino acid ABC transporter substrate-binding protein [Sterolibacteriaceae bacterium]